MRSVIFYLFLFMMVVMMTEGRRLSRRERRKLQRIGIAMLQGNFIYQLKTLEGPHAVPSDNITIIYNRRHYIYQVATGDQCRMAVVGKIHNELSVIGGEKCPLSPGEKLRFNATGFTGPSGEFFERNFAARRIRRMCSRSGFKLVTCQNEDIKREMLENARLTWTRDVWYRYPQFLHKLLCICNLKARYEYFTHFTISFYGQCQGVESIGHMQENPDGCINSAYQPCEIGVDEECAGKANFDAVYEVQYNDYYFDETEKDQIKVKDTPRDSNIMGIWNDWNPNKDDKHNDQYHPIPPMDA